MSAKIQTVGSDKMYDFRRKGNIIEFVEAHIWYGKPDDLLSLVEFLSDLSGIKNFNVDIITGIVNLNIRDEQLVINPDDWVVKHKDRIAAYNSTVFKLRYERF